MKYEVDTSCAECPLRKQRDSMIESWQSFEENVDANPNVRLTTEGIYRCPGPKKWAIGPFVLGYSCRAEDYQPQAVIVDLN